MVSLQEIPLILQNYSSFFKFLKTITISIILIVLISAILKVVEKKLLKGAKNKKQIANVEIFTRIFKYTFAILIILFVIFSLYGSLTGLGLTMGLLSAALGFALQKPITSMAAWVMLVVRRPFTIGDRVIIGSIKGDVVDITLSHIFLNEAGGLYGGEERTGRTIMVPNSTIFEESIINYSYRDDFVLGQVEISVTYESNLDKAINTSLKIAEKHTSISIDKSMVNISNRPPFIRLKMAASGVDISLRYFVPYNKMQEIQTDITREVYETFKKAKDVEIAYPHTELIFKNKELFKNSKNKK
ncbi:mechanosensitive ion channel [Candidatus Woesearchaeota archaeon]|nr:mechanosensitive ion channel [Candidatus Woesearchaeota archaeon]